MKPGIALIGPGRVGCAVTQRLHQAGYPILTVISRDLTRATDACLFIGCAPEIATTDISRAGQAELILIAVPDDQLVYLAKKLRKLSVSLTSKTLIHFSGLHPANVIGSAEHEIATLSIHPLLPFADRELASKQLAGCPCALEGDESSIPLGIELIEAFSGRAFHIASDKKALYHASACIASNYLVTLLASAAELMKECGIETSEAIPLLMPLVQASVDNVNNLGVEQGLTGPIVRGDIGTVTTHLVALGKMPVKFTDFYKQLGSETVLLAEKSTRLTKNHAEQLQKLLKSSPSQ